MLRTNIRSVIVYSFNEDGSFYGEWQSITDAARANHVTTSSISKALWENKDHFAVGKFWLLDKNDIDDAVEHHKKRLLKKVANRIEKPKEQKTQKEEPIERKGNYVFVKSSLPGNECCARCSLYYEKKCLPCREDEKHANGYWRYKRPIEL